jgi:acetoin utilization deacetylase AcuC-like enzyme
MTLAYLTHPACRLHDMGSRHPERAERLSAIEDALKAFELDGFLTRYEAPRATDEQLSRAHGQDYVASLRARAPVEGRVRLDPDTSMGPGTLEAALRAAGAAVRAVDLVMQESHHRAFCNVRPPGHHAERNRAMGFCLFNNIAVGAAHALEMHGLKRVAIVDFDVHFGNGTVEIFEPDARVLVCSTYQYPLYPGMNPPSVAGHIVNSPLPAGAGGDEFREAVRTDWLPALAEFAPQLLFVSAGFDAWAGDPLAGLQLTEADFGWVTEQLCAVAGHSASGRIVSTLEGGYALEGLAACAAAHIERLINA